MGKIEILDCTLRDGGYINNWNFGIKNIKGIINNLADSKIDYVECGFLDNTIAEYNLNYSIFTETAKAEKLVETFEKCQFALMMLLHKYDIDRLPMCSNCSVDIIRLSFHKCDVNKLIDYSIKIKERGYKLFLQPTITMSYTDKEIIYMLNKCNDIIKPDGVAIVDTLGEMQTNDIQRLTKIFDENLDINIKMLFHGHNNLQMAFSNAITFINNVHKNRDIIVDTSLMGMGKDAGNVCTELMSDYLNNLYNGNYNYNKILKVIDLFILNYKKNFDWGYNPAYMLNPKKRVHPSYGKYFKNMINNLTLIDLNNLLEKVPISERYDFNKQLAISLVNEFKIRGENHEDCCNNTNEVE